MKMFVSFCQNEDISSLLVGLRRLDLACELQARVKQATNCAILYHHTVILPIYLTHYLQTLHRVHRIHVCWGKSSWSFFSPLFALYIQFSLYFIV